MTGFYVANVLSRYWDQFLSLPRPDKLAYKLVAFVQGQVGPLFFSLKNVAKNFRVFFQNFLCFEVKLFIFVLIVCNNISVIIKIVSDLGRLLQKTIKIY